MSELRIRRESPDQPPVRRLLSASDAYMAALYPAESNHLVDLADLRRPEVRFLVARLDGRVVGCASLIRTSDDYAEIKRMFVDPAARGAGVGKALMRALGEQARADGVPVLRLETGIRQPEAIALYRRDGFVEIGPFGDYQPDPLSLFMERRFDGAL